MTLQNRADPWGQLNKVAARGTLMGNRGQLHDESREVVRQWAREAWVTCKLDFEGIRRPVFGPNAYSELFFLDEATAFSAGHRPCATCRRERYNEFKAAWLAANGAAHLLDSKAPMSTIDKILHRERVDKNAKPLEAPARPLPDGVFVEINGEAHLLWKSRLRRWSPTGYADGAAATPAGLVRVLTPPSIVRTFANGYVPDVHLSVDREEQRK
jgi:hypothetical protein